MAHPQQIKFCMSVKENLPKFFRNKIILDIGSLDINGNNQYLFEECLYLGVDLYGGKNVDISSKAHELLLPNESIDVIISTECFEHDQFYDLTLKNILRILKPGGLLLFTCATSGRPEHGTRRTTIADAPFLEHLGEWGDYYKNLEERDIDQAINIKENFDSYRFSINQETCDLYFWGVKKGNLVERYDYSFILSKNSLKSHEVYKYLIDQNKKLDIIHQNLFDNKSHIESLTDHIESLTGHIESLTDHIESLTDHIESLTDHVGSLTRIIDSLTQDITQITEKESDLVAFSNQINEHIISSQLAAKELAIEVAEMRASTSWKLTSPIRFLGNILKGNFGTSKALLANLIRRKKLVRTPPKQKALYFIRSTYHKLPLSQAAKWRLRSRMRPLLTDLLMDGSPTVSLRSIGNVLLDQDNTKNPDYELEYTLNTLLQTIAEHARTHGFPNVWISLPFLATGGAERVALNMFGAVKQLRPEQSAVLLVMDKDLVSDQIDLPPSVLLLVVDRYMSGPSSYQRKQTLLRDLLIAVRPHVFHNINSEIAWNLILTEGKRLKYYTHLYASIFAFQFAQDERTKIGYAAYFLKKGMPNLTGLLSDNQRFISDAKNEYELSPSESERMRVLYQPCRLFEVKTQVLGAQCLPESQEELSRLTNAIKKRRPQVLWAGRLDAEKRIDLFLEVVRCCSFADFRVYGKVVLDKEGFLPNLPNLSYEGSFTSPLEWTAHYKFDAYVFTSRWEGMPNILLEVGALGIPIIAPIVGGVVELVDETTGYPLPEQPSVADYERALRRVVSSPIEAMERAQRLYALIQQRHNWNGFINAVSVLPDYLPPTVTQSPHEDGFNDCAAPLITVIIPCYNQGLYLKQAIQSALAACSQPLEIIVVDDGSSDPAILHYLTEAKKLAPSIVRIHRQGNQGLSKARNSGIDLARGKYVQFLDADDILAPRKIDAQVAQLEINRDLQVSICNYLLCDETRGVFTKTEEAIARFELNEQDFLYRWERGFVIPIHCGLFRSTLLRTQRFDTEARAKEDWLFWTSLAMVGTRFGYIQGHWAIYRQHEASMRRSYMNMGRAWLQAGLKIDAMLGGREPLFFESMASWFEQCYRKDTHYQTELVELQQPSPTKKLSTQNVSSPQYEVESQSHIEIQYIAESILTSLTPVLDHDKPALFSVIIPVFNHFEFLQNCLMSLTKQGNSSFEIVLIDDGSSDKRVTQLIIALKDRHPRLIIHCESINIGISSTQNLAATLASCEYLAFLDCDDALMANALQEADNVLKLHPSIDYLFTDRMDIDEKGNKIRIAYYGGYENLCFKSQDQIIEDLIDGMVASHLKIIRKKVYQDVGGCDPLYTGVQDWELALRIAQSYSLFYLPKVLYQHRIHTNSVTSTNIIEQIQKTNVVRRKYLQKKNISNNKQPALRALSTNYYSNLKHLKNDWQEGNYCIADVRGSFNLNHVNFLREFNSYFDQILWNDPRIPSALYGYLHPEIQLTCSLD